MWVVKFKFEGGNIFFGELAKKFNIDINGYPISSYKRKDNLYVNLIGTVKGNLKNKLEIIDFLKKSKYVKNIEENNDFFNLLIKEDRKFKPFYSPFFIYLSPVLIDRKGTYHYHLGSWNRKDINRLLKLVGKKGKLSNLKQEKIKNISILGIQPNLTEKQKNAFELAVKEGYYDYPKKIELKELARIFKVSYSTYQQHLKYAEKKINEFFVGRY